MAKTIRISLAQKCQLLFGAAVVLILTAALAVVWLRMQSLAEKTQIDNAAKLAAGWITGQIELTHDYKSLDAILAGPGPDEDLALGVIDETQFEIAAANDRFLRDAIEYFQSDNQHRQFYRQRRENEDQTFYWYAHAIRKSDRVRSSRLSSSEFGATVDAPAIVNPLEKVLVIHIRSDQSARELALNRIYIVGAGLLAGLLAIATFWYITRRLILSPVRVLRDLAEKVSEGDFNIRADLDTGDEFEQLSEMFNQVLDKVKHNEQQLRGINKSLDLKLGELAETNVALYEANKIKGEFLANISHELRTPLHSMIGFAEVLQETLADRTGPVDEKRKRYVNNIITSSRRLLDLINDLLDLAKIEAGRMEIRAAPMSLADVAEGLVNLIRPQADKKQVELRVSIPPNLPAIETDAGKFQQIIFNFLSNAVKFTPAQGVVTVAANLIEPTPGQPEPRVRVSVKDTGPGIPEDQQERIFEKFTQLDATVTKEHGGTGLGLTISRDLAAMLHGRIELESEPGKGATFSLIIPLKLETRSEPLMPNLAEGTV